MSETAYLYHTLIIVPAADRERANAAAAGIGGAADLQTFTVGLSPTGVEPATHYVCATAFTAEQRAEVEGLKAVFPGAVVVDYDLDGEPDRPAAELARLGLVRVRPALITG